MTNILGFFWGVDLRLHYRNLRLYSRMSAITKQHLEIGKCYTSLSYPYPGKYLGKYMGPIDNEGILQHKFEHHVYADSFIPDIEPYFKNVPCESNSSASAASTVSKSVFPAPNPANKDPEPIDGKASGGVSAAAKDELYSLELKKCYTENHRTFGTRYLGEFIGMKEDVVPNTHYFEFKNEHGEKIQVYPTDSLYTQVRCKCVKNVISVKNLDTKYFYKNYKTGEFLGQFKRKEQQSYEQHYGGPQMWRSKYIFDKAAFELSEDDTELRFQRVSPGGDPLSETNTSVAAKSSNVPCAISRRNRKQSSRRRKSSRRSRRRM